jgi:hypothetical protein
MANVEFTTNPHDASPNCVSSVDLPHSSERATSDAQPDGEGSLGLITPLEEAIEEERTRLMLANSMLGCLQIALDPEAVRVTPAVYFPEVLELAREFINKSVNQLEYEEIRRLLHRSMIFDK